jgi:hypothetical protein
MFCNGFWKKKKNSGLLRDGDTKLHTSKNKSDCTLKVEEERAAVGKIGGGFHLLFTYILNG